MDINVKLMLVLKKLTITFMNSLGKQLEELGLGGSSYPMLAHLDAVGRVKTQELGNVAVITSGSITHMVNKLVAKGYIVKTQDQNDKRIFWVEITNLGRDIFKKVDQEQMKYLDFLLEDFSQEDKEAFIEQIKYFGRSIEKKINQDDYKNFLIWR